MRDGLGKPDRVADREYDVTDLQAVGAAENSGGKLGQLDLQHRQVGVRIPAHHLGVGGPAVRQLYPDGVRVGDHVMVGDDVAGLIDDDSGAQTVLHPLPGARQEVAKELPQRRRRGALRHQPRRIDVHDARGGKLHGSRVRHPGGRGRPRSGPDGWRRRAGCAAADQIRPQGDDQEGQGKAPDHRAGHENEPAAQSLDHLAPRRSTIDNLKVEAKSSAGAGRCGARKGVAVCV